MTTVVDGTNAASAAVLRTIAPIMGAVFLCFLIIGIAMPVLPLHVHQGLGLGPFAVGLVAGSQFAASLLSRFWAGQFADSRGAKPAVVIGLVGAIVAGALYALSLAVLAAPTLSATILLLGRGLLGAAESFVITGALGWGLARVGPRDAGKVIAWVGSAMYAAFALGAPLGTALYAKYGFGAISVGTMAIPLATLLLVLPLGAVAPLAGTRPSFVAVLRFVWVPGLGLALGSVGFGAITTFVVLLFAARGWSAGWQAVTGFALAFIVARTFLGHLPDRLGGARVALASIVVEAAGLALIRSASSGPVALAGAVLTGLGYALLYPALGVEALRRVPPESRALAMGAYTACLDLALGIATPLLGLAASRRDVGSVFLISAVTVVCAVPVAVRLMGARRAALPMRARDGVD